jgi:hypothetical protein
VRDYPADHQSAEGKQCPRRGDAPFFHAPNFRALENHGVTAPRVLESVNPRHRRNTNRKGRVAYAKNATFDLLYARAYSGERDRGRVGIEIHAHVSADARRRGVERNVSLA